MLGYRKLLLLLLLAAGACQKAAVRPPPPEASVVVPDTLVATEPAAAPESLEARPAPVEVAPVPAGVPRIGVLAPFSGPYARFGRDYLNGAQIALEAAALRTLELLPADDKGTPVAALQAVRRLDTVEQVSCVIGGFLPGSTWVAAVEANNRGLPFLCNVLQESDLTEVGPYVFHEGTSNTGSARAAADLAVLELRLFRAALLFPDEGAGRALATEFATRIGSLGGRVVASESFTQGTTDFVPLVRRVRNAGADVLYVPVKPETMLLVAPALAHQGIQSLLLGPQSWKSTRFLSRVGSDLEGAIIPESEMVGEDRAALARFEALYRQKQKQDPPRYATAGYLAARRVLEASQGGTEMQRDGLQAQLQARFAARDAQPVAFRFLIVRQGQLVPFPLP